MKIPAYQIHNVLMAYSRQLSEKMMRSNHTDDSVLNDIRPTITNSGKQKAILRKIISDIFDKISITDERDDIMPANESLIEWISEVASMRKNGWISQNRFEYIRYDENNRKSLRVLNIETA